MTPHAAAPHYVSPCGRVKLWQGDCLWLLPTIEREQVDAVLTDPPYSSGGQFRGDRTQSTVAKYVQSGALVERAEFNGDTRDQRSYHAWSALWMLAAREACKPGAPLLCFSDWRQLPTTTDAVQSAGWVWRNLLTWHKPGVRQQKGRPSLSAEYVVYGTNGPYEYRGAKAIENVFACAPVAGEEKLHIAEKPARVAEWLIATTPPGGVILDPFCGSGAFLLAALRTGRRAWGIDSDPVSYEATRRRLEEEANRTPLFTEPRQAGLFAEPAEAGLEGEAA